MIIYNTTHTQQQSCKSFFLFYLLETTEKSFSLGVIIFYSSVAVLFISSFPELSVEKMMTQSSPSFFPHRTRKNKKEKKIFRNLRFSIIEKKRLMIIDRVRRRACLIPARSKITRVYSYYIPEEKIYSILSIYIKYPARVPNKKNGKKPKKEYKKKIIRGSFASSSSSPVFFLFFSSHTDYRVGVVGCCWKRRRECL